MHNKIGVWAVVEAVLCASTAHEKRARRLAVLPVQAVAVFTQPMIVIDPLPLTALVLGNVMARRAGAVVVV